MSVAPEPSAGLLARGFASDNYAGAHPEVVEAVLAANGGHAVSYGDDPWTERLGETIRAHFGAAAVAFPVFTGTAANVLAFDSLTSPHEAVICTDAAHIHVDECGAPERIAGIKLIAVATPDGKLTPELLEGSNEWRPDPHAVQPRIVSLTNATELGTVYAPDELRALAGQAHERGLLVHVDGARLANAAASLDVTLAEITTAAGADVLSLGATKNGAFAAEAVVFLREGLGERFEFVRKQGMQLSSKMRFVSAQLEAILGGDLWLRNARAANAMAARLAAAITAIDGVEIVQPVQSNAVFAAIDPDASERLRASLAGPNPFYVWAEPGPGASRQIVRWMCSWDTTAEDVDAFAGAVASAVDR